MLQGGPLCSRDEGVFFLFPTRSGSSSPNGFYFHSLPMATVSQSGHWPQSANQGIRIQPRVKRDKR